MLTVVVVASTASLLPPLLSVDALSSPRPHLTHFLTYFHSTFVVLLLLYITSSLPHPPPFTLPHISLASGPEDVGAAIGRAGGGAEGEDTFRTTVIAATDTLHASAWLAWL